MPTSSSFLMCDGTSVLTAKEEDPELSVQEIQALKA